jgi:hypothetical protein
MGGRISESCYPSVMEFPHRICQRNTLQPWSTTSSRTARNKAQSMCRTCIQGITRWSIAWLLATVGTDGRAMEIAQTDQTNRRITRIFRVLYSSSCSAASYSSQKGRSFSLHRLGRMGRHESSILSRPYPQAFVDGRA